MLVLLLPQLHPKCPTPTARRAQRRSEGRAQGQAGGVLQLALHVIVDVGEGLAGGDVGQPASGREAAAGARAQCRIPVAGVQGQVELPSGPEGRLSVPPFSSAYRQCRLQAAAGLGVAAGGDGGDLDARAVEGSGVLLGTWLNSVKLLETLGLVSILLLVLASSC